MNLAKSGQASVWTFPYFSPKIKNVLSVVEKLTKLIQENFDDQHNWRNNYQYGEPIRQKSPLAIPPRSTL